MRKYLNKIRKGFSLVEVSLALVVASTVMTYIYSILANTIRLQQETEFLNTAIFLAKLKVSQIDASSSLEDETLKGKIPGYKGFSFETEVKEDELDLFKLAGFGDESDISSIFGDKDSKLNEIIKEKNSQQNLKTAGLIRVFKMKVSIFYSVGNQTKEYTIETFKPTKF